MVSFYRFFPRGSTSSFSDISQLRDDCFDGLVDRVPGLRGTLYIAQEGFNGQFAVPLEFMDDFLEVLDTVLFLESDDDNDDSSTVVVTAKDIMNYGDVVPIDIPTFQRLIVRTRDSILRDGLMDHDSLASSSSSSMDLDWDNAGEELSPELWDEELRNQQQQQQQQPTSSSSSGSLILDCRNDYESNQGTFQNAIPLNTTTFAESWKILDDHASSLVVENKNDPVYIYCTGGIRCVKVGAYMTQKLGFTNVKRLQHGIIGYQKWWDNNNNKEAEDKVEDATTEEDSTKPSAASSSSSLWQGENFLFDKRRFAEEKEESSRPKRNS